MNVSVSVIVRVSVSGRVNLSVSVRVKVRERVRVIVRVKNSLVVGVLDGHECCDWEVLVIRPHLISHKREAVNNI